MSSRVETFEEAYEVVVKSFLQSPLSETKVKIHIQTWLSQFGRDNFIEMVNIHLNEDGSVKNRFRLGNEILHLFGDFSPYDNH